jgi:hypothetical protein
VRLETEYAAHGLEEGSPLGVVGILHHQGKTWDLTKTVAYG